MEYCTSTFEAVAVNQVDCVAMLLLLYRFIYIYHWWDKEVDFPQMKNLDPILIKSYSKIVKLGLFSHANWEFLLHYQWDQMLLHRFLANGIDFASAPILR